MIYIEKKLNNSWAILLVRILATGPYFEVLGPPSAQMDYETGKAALQEAYSVQVLYFYGRYCELKGFIFEITYSQLSIPSIHIYYKNKSVYLHLILHPPFLVNGVYSFAPQA